MAELLTQSRCEMVSKQQKLPLEALVRLKVVI